jgi:hypothetical protein
MMNELPIPPVASKTDESVELVRLWAADRKLHCVLRIGHWEERGLDELSAWGLVLADMVHHIANAHADEYGHEPPETIRAVRKAFEAEMDYPTSSRLGEFLREPTVTRRTRRPRK